MRPVLVCGHDPDWVVYVTRVRGATEQAMVKPYQRQRGTYNGVHNGHHLVRVEEVEVVGLDSRYVDCFAQMVGMSNWPDVDAV